jgi:uncharacterized protein (DUF1800 family)
MAGSTSRWRSRPVRTSRPCARIFGRFRPTSPRPRINNANRQIAWWQLALTAPDQLRQRVAFALSEIFVVSDVNDALANNRRRRRRLLRPARPRCLRQFPPAAGRRDVAPHHGRLFEPFEEREGDEKRGTSADENYAREVMQLFTIGLNELQPDGTYRLGKDGRPIATYDQSTIVETAKVFTGWGFYSPEPKPNFFGARANFHPADDAVSRTARRRSKDSRRRRQSSRQARRRGRSAR